jgi:hypothetical protein
MVGGFMGRASRSSRWGLVHFLCRWARRWTGVGADACWWRVAALLVVCKAGQLFRASMSPRTFARRFRQRTGTTPGSWVNQQRVLLAARLLERGNDTIAAVSVHSGFGGPDTLRRHFIQARGNHTQPAPPRLPPHRTRHQHGRRHYF